MKKFITFKNFLLANTVFPVGEFLLFYFGNFPIQFAFWTTIATAALLFAANIFFYLYIPQWRPLILIITTLNILSVIFLSVIGIIAALPIILDLLGFY